MDGSVAELRSMAQASEMAEMVLEIGLGLSLARDRESTYTTLRPTRPRGRLRG